MAVMHPALGVQTPPRIATEAFCDAAAAVARLDDIYERNSRFLRDRFEAYANGEVLTKCVRATYPFVRVTTSTHARPDSRLSYGFVGRPGVHETTVTRPDLFRAYLTEQIRLLIDKFGRGAIDRAHRCLHALPSRWPYLPQQQCRRARAARVARSFCRFGITIGSTTVTQAAFSSATSVWNAASTFLKSAEFGSD